MTRMNRGKGINGSSELSHRIELDRKKIKEEFWYFNRGTRLFESLRVRAGLEFWKEGMSGFSYDSAGGINRWTLRPAPWQGSSPSFPAWGARSHDAPPSTRRESLSLASIWRIDSRINHGLVSFRIDMPQVGRIRWQAFAAEEVVRIAIGSLVLGLVFFLRIKDWYASLLS